MAALVVLTVSCGGGGDNAEAGASGAAATGSGGSDSSSDGSTSGADPSEKLRVGVLVPTGGVFADIGEDIVNGFELYAKQNDDALGGMPYELFVEDTEANPDTGVRKAEKLISENEVDVVVGVVSSAVGVATRDVFDRMKTPVIITNSNTNALSCDLASPYVFRSSASSYQQGFLNGKWIAENVGTEGWYLQAPDYVAGEDMLNAFKEGFTEGGGSPDGIVGENTPPFQSTQDYQPFLSQIQNSDAQYVWAFHGGGEAINFVQQYQNFGLKDSLPLYGWGSLADDGILEAIGPAAEGVITAAYYTSTLDNPTNEQFVTDFSEEFGGVPTYFAESAYDAAKLVALAVESLEGEIASTDELAEALRTVGPFDAPRGTFELNPDTQNPILSVHIREVQKVDGELQNVVIAEAGTIAEACPPS